MTGLVKLWSGLSELLVGNRTRGEIEEWVDRQYYSFTGRDLIDLLLSQGVIEASIGPMVAMTYHRASQLRNLSPPLEEQVRTSNWLPDTSKRYDDAQVIELPQRTLVDVPLEKAALGRVSTRSFTRRPLSLSDLSALLYLAYGPTRARLDRQESIQGPPRNSPNQTLTNEQRIYRPSPSAGALYPLELYSVALNVPGLSGVYHYQRDDHRLELLKEGNYSAELVPAFYNVVDFHSASLLILVSAIFLRSAKKYGERSYRFIFLEAGHVAQNLILAAAGMGWGAVPLGGFADERLNSFLGFEDESEAVVYAVALGSPPTEDE